MIVIGTAGHIDHGKSSIVKRLTGTDPDRLPEEKKRGMTIDLGFAFYKTPKNDTVAFVDVPGHERFVKNMIAGAGGIDAVMLVIAADDGWMPQTEEHFQIVRLLGIKTGFVVINKCDLADKESIARLKKNIENQVSESFLKDSPILEVSSITGKGFEELEKYVSDLSEKITAGLDIGKARLYIDRVFTQQGIGAVATGTLRGGTLNVGDNITIWPSQQTARIKSLQSNNQNVSKAAPSQRTAITLAGVSKEGLKRGGAITRISDLDYFKKNPVLAIKVEILKNSPVSIENKRRILLLVGTSETEGEIRLFGGVRIHRRETGIVFFKPKNPVFTLIGDRVIIRLPSPMLTIGGGMVLDHLNLIPSGKDLLQKDYLQNRDITFIKQLVISELQKQIAVRESELLKFSSRSNDDIAGAIEELLIDSRIGKSNGYIFELANIRKLSLEVLHVINGLHHSNKGIGGLKLAQIAKSAGISEDVAHIVTDILIFDKKVKSDGELIRPIEAAGELSPEVQNAYNDITSELEKNQLMPPELGTLAKRGKAYKEAIRIMLQTGAIHKCGSDFVFSKSVWLGIHDYIKKTLAQKNTLTVAELRDKFQITRKYAVPILEEMDRLKLTRRQGDIRVRGEKFEE